MKKLLLSLVGILCTMSMWAGNFPTGKTWDLTAVAAEIENTVGKVEFANLGEKLEDGNGSKINHATYYSNAMWCWDSKNNCFCNYFQTTSSNYPLPLYLNEDTECQATEGLKFYWNGLNKVRITSSGFNLQSTNSFIVIPGLVKNQLVTITSKVAVASKGNLTEVSTSGETYVFKATADGDVKFTYASSKGNITAISVAEEPAPSSDKSVTAEFSTKSFKLTTGDVFVAPSLTVVDEDDQTLTLGTDYTVAYSSNNTEIVNNNQQLVAVNSGSATVTGTITLIGSYATGYVVDSNPTYIVNFTKMTPINGKAICTVDTDNGDALTDATYFVNTLKAQDNSGDVVTVDGVGYTKGLKTESSTSISFKTGSNPALLKVVFSPYSNKANMKLNGTKVDADANNVYYAELAANTVYEITKADQSFLYYIGVFEKFKKVTVSSAGYATWYAEYDTSLPAGITAFTATVNGEKTQLNLTPTPVNLVQKNKGVVIKAAAGDYYMNETNQAVNTTTVLSGTVTGTTLTAEDYVLGNGDNGIGFYHLDAPYALDANKAYLPSSAVAGARSISIRFNNETTGINTIDANAVNNASAYNLAGQRVAKNAKGIVIINGKKFVNK